MESRLPAIRAGESLNSFIFQKLLTPRKHRVIMSKAVDSIVRHLHSMPNYNIKEVVKSGSLGKGTTVRDYADADLVIFFNGYQTIDELIKCEAKQKQNDIIADISSYMKEFDRSVFKCEMVRDDEFLGRYRLKHIQTNTFVDVDILPALDVVALNGSVSSVREEMKSKPPSVREHYSVCFCKEQLKLIKAVTAKLKDLIRLVKYWKNSNKLPIKSYFCEVACLYVYEKFLGQQTNFNMKVGFNRVLQFLIEIQTTHTVIDPKYYYSARNWYAVFSTQQEATMICQVARQTIEALRNVPDSKREKKRRNLKATKDRISQA